MPSLVNFADKVFTYLRKSYSKWDKLLVRILTKAKVFQPNNKPQQSLGFFTHVGQKWILH